MLQRVENVKAFHERGPLGLLTGKGQVVVLAGRKRLTVDQKIHRTEFAQMREQSSSWPVCFVVAGERAYWRFGDRWFWDNEGLNAEEVYTLIVTRDQHRQASISRAQSTVAMAQEPTPVVRGAIPENLKQLVWTRDQGRCRQCGSNAELQFDHVIPWSMGGGTTPANIQVLCGPCNRRKGASVASPMQPGAAQATAPGWYLDPTAAGGLRYWNGSAWTDDVSTG